MANLLFKNVIYQHCTAAKSAPDVPIFNGESYNKDIDRSVCSPFNEAGFSLLSGILIAIINAFYIIPLFG